MYDCLLSGSFVGRLGFNYCSNTFNTIDSLCFQSDLKFLFKIVSLNLFRKNLYKCWNMFVSYVLHFKEFFSKQDYRSLFARRDNPPFTMANLFVQKVVYDIRSMVGFRSVLNFKIQDFGTHFKDGSLRGIDT